MAAPARVTSESQVATLRPFTRVGRSAYGASLGRPLTHASSFAERFGVPSLAGAGGGCDCDCAGGTEGVRGGIDAALRAFISSTPGSKAIALVIFENDSGVFGGTLAGRFVRNLIGGLMR